MQIKMRQRVRDLAEVSAYTREVIAVLNLVPETMYASVYREEALKHFIESLGSARFERVAGRTVENFRALSDRGLINS